MKTPEEYLESLEPGVISLTDVKNAFLAGDANGYARAVKECVEIADKASYEGCELSQVQWRLKALLPDWATSQQKEGE